MGGPNHQEPYDLVLDWQEAQGRSLTLEECEVAAETEAQLAAYTGRMYGDIRMDIARCAVAKLTAMQPTVTDNVTPLRPTRSELFAATRYIAVSSPVNK